MEPETVAACCPKRLLYTRAAMERGTSSLSSLRLDEPPLSLFFAFFLGFVGTRFGDDSKRGRKTRSRFRVVTFGVFLSVISLS